MNELCVDDALGYHATSMYSVGKIMHDGQCRTGFAENTQGNKTMKGDFFMLPAQAQCCDNYMHYVTLDDNGWLYGVLLQHKVRRESHDPAGRGQTLKRKNNQRLTYEGRHSLNSVFFHVMHITQLLMVGSNGNWVLAEPGYQVCLEIPHDDAWEEIILRSERLRCAPCRPPAAEPATDDA